MRKTNKLMLLIAFTVFLGCPLVEKPNNIKPSSSPTSAITITTSPSIKPASTIETQTPLPVKDTEGIELKGTWFLCFGESYQKDKFYSDYVSLMKENNSEFYPVTKGAYPLFSPNGKKIALLNDFEKRNILSIVDTDFSEKNKRDLFKSDFLIRKYDWITDSKIILQTNQEIYLIETSLNKSEKIISNVYGSYDLSPDKKKIAYISDSGKDKALFIADYDGKNFIPILNNSDFPVNEVNIRIRDFYGNLKWSDDMENIAFINKNRNKINSFSIKDNKIKEISDFTEEGISKLSFKASTASWKNKFIGIPYYNENGQILFTYEDSEGDGSTYPIFSSKPNYSPSNISFVGWAGDAGIIVSNSLYKKYFLFYNDPGSAQNLLSNLNDVFLNGNRSYVELPIKTIKSQYFIMPVVFSILEKKDN